TLSLFEFGTLAALRLFQTEQVEVILLEVGLGGRLDATNVVEHDVSVITSLAIDHVDWLGDDINVIGFEKAGIFRSGKPAICGQPS
ncbi:Mur ligase family protein, partial [Salmonella enterica]|nr:Mur ligase family protein [Salmonella enterica]